MLTVVPVPAGAAEAAAERAARKIGGVEQGPCARGAARLLPALLAPRGRGIAAPLIDDAFDEHGMLQP